MVNESHKLTVINAPAGSGKTTHIAECLKQYVLEHKNAQVLCITYTNRATDELKIKIDDPNITISTIHSFILSLSESLFKQQSVQELYLEIFAEQINTIIMSNDDKALSKKERFSQKIGTEATMQNVRSHILNNGLYYTDSNSDAFLYGGLSHNSLLSFFASCVTKFPHIKRRISGRYRLIIIDEYQDTNIDILKTFKDCTIEGDTKLILFGDRMQQIYKTDYVKFEEVIRDFAPEEYQITNYRSSKNIVSVLNSIYNQQNHAQKAYSQDLGKAVLYITDRPADLYKEIAKTGEYVSLLLSNREVYKSCNAESLYVELNKLKEHRYGSDFTAAAALSTIDLQDNKSSIMRPLYALLHLGSLYEASKIGEIISFLSIDNKVLPSFRFERHEDKNTLKQWLEQLFELMNQDVSIQEVLQAAISIGNNHSSHIEKILMSPAYEYGDILKLPFSEVRNAYTCTSARTASTQHGAKGEGHAKVILLPRTNRNEPNVEFSMLLKLWSKENLDLKLLEDSFIEFKESYGATIGPIFEKPKAVSADKFKLKRSQVEVALAELETKLSDNIFYKHIFSHFVHNLKSNLNASNFNKLPGVKTFEGILLAYKLFYVGCSRAKEELHVIIDEKEIHDKRQVRELFERLNFEVKEHP